MKVTVRGFGHLVNFLGHGRVVVEVTEEATVGEALSQLGLPPGLALTIFINDRQGTLVDHVREGDTLLLIPAVVGGMS